MNDEQKKTRFREWVKAMPEKERNAFVRGIMDVVDAGIKTNTPAEMSVKYWVEIYTETNKQLKENTNG